MAGIGALKAATRTAGYVEPKVLGGLGVAAGTTTGGIYAKARVDQLREQARKAKEEAELKSQGK